MAIERAQFAQTQKTVGAKKARKSSLAEPLSVGLGVVGGVAGAIAGTGWASVPAAMGGATAGAALGERLGTMLDPGRQAKAGRVEYSQAMQAPSLDSKKLGFEPSQRSNMIADALAALNNQPDDLKASYSQPLATGLMASLAVDKQLNSQPQTQPGQPVPGGYA